MFAISGAGATPELSMLYSLFPQYRTPLQLITILVIPHGRKFRLNIALVWLYSRYVNAVTQFYLFSSVCPVQLSVMCSHHEAACSSRLVSTGRGNWC